MRLIVQNEQKKSCPEKVLISGLQKSIFETKNKSNRQLLEINSIAKKQTNKITFAIVERAKHM